MAAKHHKITMEVPIRGTDTPMKIEAWTTADPLLVVHREIGRNSFHKFFVVTVLPLGHRIDLQPFRLKRDAFAFAERVASPDWAKVEGSDKTLLLASLHKIVSAIRAEFPRD